jgi:hypothetical protein
MRRTDPYATLGLEPGASPEDVTLAYRRLAKRWHPDRAGTRESAQRMAEINAAYELLRDGAGVRPPVVVPEEEPARPRAQRVGAWLSPEVRRALGEELLVALEHREDVRLVTAASARGAGPALLALTDRRLLWLLDERVMGRVGSVRLSAIAAIEQRLSWPRRRSAGLRVRTADGRRLAFGDLDPATAGRIVSLVRPAAARP